jgi:hypothetical protein
LEIELLRSGQSLFGSSPKAATVVCGLFCLLHLSAPAHSYQATEAVPAIETIQQRAFDFFWNETHPETGLTKDREKNHDGPDAGKSTVASIASTGYMLATLPIGVEHGWITRQQGYDRALKTLQYIHDKLPSVHGFYYHFVDWRTGQRVWNSELSSIDSALLALGGLAAGEYWPNTHVHRLAEQIAGRMDWPWMQTDGGAKPQEMAPSMGWDPKKGFLKSRWSGYNESAFLYFLALGTPGDHALPRRSWDAWTFKATKVEGQTVFGGPAPIFMAQMTPGFFDLRGMRDRRQRDWWTAWKNAHLADQAYCARSSSNKTYAAGFWAINASDEPNGYGADSPMDGRNSGTVSPTGMLAGLLFTPERAVQSQRDLWALELRLEERASSRGGKSQADLVPRHKELGTRNPQLGTRSGGDTATATPSTSRRTGTTRM